MRNNNPWARISFDLWSLGIDASAVVALRIAKMAKGGAGAEAEGRQMVLEKMDSAFALQEQAFAGALGWSVPGAATKTIAHYRTKVRANCRRLSKEK